MILASNNAHKLTEIRAILADLGIDLISQREAGCDFEVEETQPGTYVVTFTVPAELAEDYATGSGTSEEPTGYTGFDLYYSLDFDGSFTGGLYESVNDYFEVEAAEEAPAEEASEEAAG